MQIPPGGRKIRFGHCTLDDGRGVLIAPNGTETLLRPKTLELLRLLLRNPGRVVARDEILDAVWPGVFVTDDSITQCVVELRKGMGEVGTVLLRTVPRRGYLLQAPVMVEEAPPPTALSLLPPRVDDRPSIAVLPFRKGQTDPQDAYFADGIVEGIVHVLSGLERILVISRGSAHAVAGATTDPREVGRLLSVRYVLQGGIRRAADRLRITTELAETETGAIIRSERHEGVASDLFALQDRIAEQVVTTIVPGLREQEVMRAMRKPPSSLTAYDLLLRALDRLHRLDHAAFEEARVLLDQAIAADPEFALARTYLAWWHTLRVAQGWSPDPLAEAQAIDRVTDAAMARDTGDALAMALRANALGFVQHDFAVAEALLDQAIRLAPSCALAWSFGAVLRCWLNRGEEAVDWAERAVRLGPIDPFAFFYEHVLSQALHAAGDYQSSVAWAQRSARSNPQHSPTWRTMIASLVALDRLDEVIEPRKQVMTLEPSFGLRALAARTPLRSPAREAFMEKLRRGGLPD